jgi:hypothetical protein
VSNLASRKRMRAGPHAASTDSGSAPSPSSQCSSASARAPQEPPRRLPRRRAWTREAPWQAWRDRRSRRRSRHPRKRPAAAWRPRLQRWARSRRAARTPAARARGAARPRRAEAAPPRNSPGVVPAGQLHGAKTNHAGQQIGKGLPGWRGDVRHGRRLHARTRRLSHGKHRASAGAPAYCCEAG